MEYIIKPLLHWSSRQSNKKKYFSQQNITYDKLHSRILYKPLQRNNTQKILVFYEWKKKTLILIFNYKGCLYINQDARTKPTIRWQQ